MVARVFAMRRYEADIQIEKKKIKNEINNISEKLEKNEWNLNKQQ